MPRRKKTAVRPTEDNRVVKNIPNGDGKTRAHTQRARNIMGSSSFSGVPPARGKPAPFATTTTMKTKFASASVGTGYANVAEGSGGNFYSPELSTDFLELPQSLHESWNYYRFFYRTTPFVRQALDLHTELPLSKIRISIPSAQNRDLAVKATRFCEKWAARVGLLRRLIAVVHDYHLIGEVFIWVEDTNPDMPHSVQFEKVRELNADGELEEHEIERADANERAVQWLRKNYKGWTSVRVLPPEQIRMESFNFTEEKILELIPDSKTKDIIQRAQQGDTAAAHIVESMPREVVSAVTAGRNIPLNTDPEAGSFCYYMANKKSDYDARGHSLLESCIRTLTLVDKLRQAQTSIASRHMTPIRVVWAENMDAADIEALREQIDLALQDPDFSVIANFQLNWEEMGSEQRLLDLSAEYDLADRQLYAGLGVTEGLLSGESAYSGDRINLEVINTRYMLLRELLQDFVENCFFRPMCSRMGFIEEDEDGDETIIVPRLSFTRLALRDNNDTFEALLSLYNKGSLDIDVILELLNIDPVSTLEKLKRDTFTLNDAVFTEALRNLYSEAGRKLVEETNVVEKLAKYLDLKYQPPKEDTSRY